MAAFYALGNALVGAAELGAKAASGELSAFAKQVTSGRTPATLEFTSGVATADNLGNQYYIMPAWRKYK